ncbi:hypothetical protein ACFL20_10250 [Spirochaetota bacterium]
MTNRKFLIMIISISMAVFTLCKNEVKIIIDEDLLLSSQQIDDNACLYAQYRFGDINETSGINVVSIDEGTNFITSKATVDNNPDTVTARFGFEQGTHKNVSGKKLNTILMCKTRTPEAIKYITENNYTVNDNSPGTCKEINQYIYEQTRTLLTDEERIKYDTEGKQLVFGNDTIDGSGETWLPTDPFSLITDSGTDLNISSASLVSDFDADISDNSSNPARNTVGVKYCKLISSQNFLAWMLIGAFKDSDNLVESDTYGLSCSDIDSSRGSCLFTFTGGNETFQFCEDYVGTDYTGGVSGSARSKCLNERLGTYVDGVACSDRTDITDEISGICAIDETPKGAYTWTLYFPDVQEDCPRRFMICE